MVKDPVDGFVHRLPEVMHDAVHRLIIFADFVNVNIYRVLLPFDHINDLRCRVLGNRLRKIIAAAVAADHLDKTCMTKFGSNLLKIFF